MEVVADRYTRARAGRVFDLPMLALFCAANRRPLLERVGMLDERYEIGMFEDDDLARTLKALGKRVVCAEDVFIHHVGKGSLGSSTGKHTERSSRRIGSGTRPNGVRPGVAHRYRPAGASQDRHRRGSEPHLPETPGEQETPIICARVLRPLPRWREAP